MGVDCPRDIYLASRALRGSPAPVAFTETDLLNALYLASGSLPEGAFYAPLWAALEAAICEAENYLRLTPP